MGADEPRFRVLHVSNVSMSATREQIYQLFAFIGRIDEFKIYPTDNHPQLSSFSQKFAYVKFEEAKSVEIAQHLTNTVFIDRALVCIPSISDTIPDEETALTTGGPLWPGQRQLPPSVSNQIQDLGDGQQMLLTVDPSLTSLGLPPYPALPANTDASKVEEIRRTIYVGNIPKECDGEEVMRFFNDNIGEVMYLRMASGQESLPCAYAYVEFTNQPTIPIALQNNGIEFKGRCLRIQHSRVAIIKPERKTADMAMQEVEEAIRVNQNPDKSANALSKLNQGLGIDRGYSPLRSISPRRRRSRSGDRRRRSRSRSPRRSRRSRSRDYRDRSRSRDRRRRSKSRDRRKSRSKDRKDKDKDEKDKDKDKDKSKDKEKEKDKEKSRRDKDKDKEKDKEKEKDKKDRRRSRSRSARRKDEKREREKEREKERRKEKEKESDRKRDRGKEKDKDRSRRDSRSERSRRESRDEKERERRSGRDRDNKERDRGSSKRGDDKSAIVAKPDVKLQIEDGENMDGMEVVEASVVTTTDESAMRERLLEKVLARNGGASKDGDGDEDDHGQTPTKDNDNGNDQIRDELKRSSSDDVESSSPAKKKPRDNESSSSSESSDSDSE